MYPSAVLFVLVHLAAFAAIWTGVTWEAVYLCLALYGVRMFAITAGFHRYFSHRSFTTGRAFQFVLAFVAQSSAQKSVLWWAAKHRHHHLYSDTPADVHSPRQRGFVYSHLGWIFARQHDGTDLAKVADLARYPELMWLHRLELAPAIAVGTLCFLIGGWTDLVVGFIWSTVLLWHGTFCINSLAHVLGRKRYVTGDDSRNNWLLAIITLGEGWHNNHHAYQSCVRQGFRWWEFDPTYYVLKVLSWFGVVANMKAPPERVVRNEQRLGARIIDRAAAELAARYDVSQITLAIVSAMRGPHLPALRDTVAALRESTTNALKTLHLPQIPGRDEMVAEARAIFAQTRSLDDIVDRAREMLLLAIGVQLQAAVERA